MALEREDVCRHFMNGAVFEKCLFLYTGSSGQYRANWEVCVHPSDMPEGQQTNPTHAQLVPVADQKAIPMYNAWLATLPNNVEEHDQDGVGGTVVP